MTLEERIRELEASGRLDLPKPGAGKTAERHSRLLEIAREDVSLARLAEAHCDALAILAEAGKESHRGLLYGVWASENDRDPLRLQCEDGVRRLCGVKMFCTGAGLVDRALITVQTPERRLVVVNLRSQAATLSIDAGDWKSNAFAGTKTATVRFCNTVVTEEDLVGEAEWYVSRPGFWHGAFGPAACWAGGAVGLVDYALKQSRKDPHTLAHLGAMSADAWAMRTYLEAAGNEIDHGPDDWETNRQLALQVRHLIVQACNDVLQRMSRAYGPRPLAYDAEIARRAQELTLYLTQSHAERDLEVIGKAAMLS